MASITDDSFWDGLSPLWTDEDILRAIEACNFENYEEDMIEPLLHKMRDEYESAFDLLRAENNMLFDRAAKRLAINKELQANVNR